MRNDYEFSRDCVRLWQAGGSVSNNLYSVSEALDEIINRYEAPLLAEIERLREALERVVDHAEDWHEHYCGLWGERRKEQQDAILGDILNARAALVQPKSTP